MKSKWIVHIYVTFLAIISIIMLIALYQKYGVNSETELIFWAILAIITETFLIPIPSTRMAVSVGLAVSIAALLSSQAFVGALVSGLAFVLRMPKIGDRRIHLFNTPICKTVFNCSQSIIIIGLAGEILYEFFGFSGLTEGFNFTNFTTLIPSVFLVVAFCDIINPLLVAIFLNMLNGLDIFKTVFDGIKGMVTNMLGIGTLGIILALMYNEYHEGVVIFFAPLLLARYSFKLYVDSQNMAMDTIHALNDALEVKDAYTGGHAARVQEYAVKLAKAKGLKKSEVEKIRTAALLHDIGKIGIPDYILNKQGKLTEDEFQTIKQHPVMGAKILHNVDSLKDISNIIRYHHERYDGKGYPESLKYGNIPLESSILSIADSFDAMTTDRPYKAAMTTSEALDELKKNKGSQFDPVLVDLFVNDISIKSQKLS